MQRAHRPGLLFRHACLHGFAGHPVHAEQQQVVGVAVVGAYRDALVGGAEFGDRLDGLRQRMPGRRRRATAQEQPYTGFEQVVGDVAVDGFMRVGNAGGGVGRDKFAPVDMAADRASTRKCGGENGVAALVAHGDRHEIHLFAECDGLRPFVEQGGDLVRRQVPACRFQLRRGGGHGAGHGEEDGERRFAGILQHRLDARDIHDVADLVAVAEDRGGAVQEGGFRIGAGRHHRGFDMDMRIDKAGGDDATARIVDGRTFATKASRRFHRRHAAPADPDLTLGQDALGIGGEHAGIADHQIGRCAGGGHIGQRAGQLRKRGNGKAGQTAHNIVQSHEGMKP